MEEDQKPFPTMLFVNEAFLHSKALESSEINAEIKREDDESSDFCLQTPVYHVEKGECEFDDIVSSYSNQDVVLLKIEKKEEEHNFAYDSTWIKSESEIQVDTDSDDDNIEIKVERDEKDFVLVHNPNQMKFEHEMQVDTDSLISNDYCHTEVENDGSNGFCLPIKSEIGQNQAASLDCYDEIKLGQNEEDDISFTDTCPATNTDSPDIPTHIQEQCKDCSVYLRPRIDEVMENLMTNNKAKMSSTLILDHNKRMGSMENTGEKPLKCTVCDKPFTQSSHLISHLRIHAGEKPFECTICDKTFTQSSSLTSHLRIHTGEKPFECTVCDKTFTQSSSLISHMTIHTGEKTFKCTVCDKKFATSSNRIKHIDGVVN